MIKKGNFLNHVTNLCMSKYWCLSSDLILVMPTTRNENSLNQKQGE